MPVRFLCLPSAPLFDKQRTGIEGELGKMDVRHLRNARNAQRLAYTA